VMMPVMDGIAATKAIRSSDHPLAKTIPIVAMTANAFEDDVRKMREAGMNEHLSKPIRITEVLKTIRRVLKTSGGG
ncbi:MAG TPA: hybrid sensor histidine kinase/response regulator, partial [Clostridiales bacterium]|nr:hybrid sensor histidine kinase/response regulator [Clostridiales bacterium]